MTGLYDGHTFPGSALILCDFDYRVIREDSGYWCMNEADIELPLDAQSWSLLTNWLPRATAWHAAFTSHRLGTHQALARGIVQTLAPTAAFHLLAVAQPADLLELIVLPQRKRFAATSS